MKFISLFAFAICFISCSDSITTTYTVQHQVITPHSLIFASADTMKTISITHTCTCPFSWNVNVLTATQALQSFSGTGDNAKVEIHLDRTKLMVDTLMAMMEVHSAYGRDTVQVTVLR